VVAALCIAIVGGQFITEKESYLEEVAELRHALDHVLWLRLALAQQLPSTRGGGASVTLHQESRKNPAPKGGSFFFPEPEEHHHHDWSPCWWW
jgi:hypothetical protein